VNTEQIKTEEEYKATNLKAAKRPTKIKRTKNAKKDEKKSTQRCGWFFACVTQISGVPKGIRTPVLTVKG
jgi:hypothetical protein